MDHGPDFYAAITLAEGDRVLMWLGVQLLDDEQLVDARAGAHLDLENGIRVGTGPDLGEAADRCHWDRRTVISYDARAGEVSLDRNRASRRDGTLGGR